MLPSWQKCGREVEVVAGSQLIYFWVLRMQLSKWFADCKQNHAEGTPEL